MKISNINKTTLNVVVALYFSSFANANLAPTEFPTFSPTLEETGFPTFSPVGGLTSSPEHTYVPTDPDVTGDPHFRTWSGESYDFHGVCDLVLLKNAQFDEGLGMDIHIRSKRMYAMFSYVHSASVRIGDDTLEVRGGKEDGLWMNGEQVVDINNDKEAVVLSNKFPVVIEKLSEKSKEVRINLGGAEAIVIRTWNKMVRVSISHATNENFGTSLGMMGAFSTGAKLGRDGITNIEDFNIFGQEWQVLPTEANLFHEIGDAVQSPAQCEIPSSSQMRRRLSEASVTVEEAKIACDGVAPADLDLCMFDIMASNDKNLAGAY